ncbi:phosphoethanolamine transferase [Acidovorax sp. A1169]|uniref:phosphoethanolamine transferase n=1 Tax=Acidovorax sp. A1169 TaxID=3059524 RepID=UPI0027379F4E|nr:phosphoethanolamine--lipid A transferase [Acidovorax sp. A1169]MDP4076366.1 phosphoethanolamine--lipid A transferase [Acidovorax sp. A1169]
MIKRARSPIWLVAVGSVWLAVSGSGPLWRRLSALEQLQSVADFLFAFSLLGLISACLASVLSLFAWRQTLKPAITVLLCITALASHFMTSYGVVIDTSMLINVMQTDTAEASAFLDGHLLTRLMLMAVVPAIFVWLQPIDYGTMRRQLWKNPFVALCALVIVVAVILSGFQRLASTMRNHKDLRYLLNPLASMYGLARMAMGPLERDESTIVPIALDAGQAGRTNEGNSTPIRPRLLLLVLGETARSANFSLNGYERPTTTALEQQGVVSFTNVWSCGTSTAESLPCMFSHLSRHEFGVRKVNYENLLDVLQRAGLAVLWLDNQSGCKGVCDRVPHVSTGKSVDSDLCKDNECQDGILLSGLDERLAALDPARRARGTVIVMHQMGSHGPAYFRRSPEKFKTFHPECTTSALQVCSRDMVLNAYDNSIVYTDHFLSSAIDWLRHKAPQADGAMLYVSDHGESLGESNLYLHGLPYAIAPDVQKHIPWVTWMSAQFEESLGISLECLGRQRHLRVTHDNYFHSILGLMDVSTSVYETELDAYALCRKRL